MLEDVQLWQITFYGFAAGVVGTGLGGFLAFIFPRPREDIFSGALGFAAGVMMAVVFLELVEEALDFGGLPAALVGMLLGLGVFFLLDQLIPHQHAVTEEQTEHQARYLKKGVLLALGIALHNLPEGMAIGAGYVVSVETGFLLAVVLALHNIPEGLAVAIPLKAIGRGGLGLYAALLAGVPMGIGAFIGGAVSAISPFFLGASLGFAGGAMLYIVCDELIPDAYETSRGHAPILGITLGVVVGMLITAL